MRPRAAGAFTAWRQAFAAFALALSAAGALALESDWAALPSAEQRALAPLARLWDGMAADERAQWRALAERMAQRTPAEQARLQQRMSDWARLAPAQRGQARIQFQQAQRWSAEERRQRWQDYQSLDPQARAVLAERWRLEQPSSEGSPGGDDDGGKRNLVEVAPVPRAPLQAAGATAVRAPRGATTKPLTRAPAPPPHHQHGLPKVVAGETFVDPSTLLPRRGPQGAAIVAPAAAKPAPARATAAQPAQDTAAQPASAMPSAAQPAPPAAEPAEPRRPAAPAR